MASLRTLLNTECEILAFLCKLVVRKIIFSLYAIQPFDKYFGFILSHNLARHYERAKYIGMVDIGLVITGLRGSVVYTDNFRLQYTRSPYDRDSYKKTGRFSALQMLDDPKNPSKYLVVPFINAISQGWIDPFQQK